MHQTPGEKAVSSSLPDTRQNISPLQPLTPTRANRDNVVSLPRYRSHPAQGIGPRLAPQMVHLNLPAVPDERNLELGARISFGRLFDLQATAERQSACRCLSQQPSRTDPTHERLMKISRVGRVKQSSSGKSRKHGSSGLTGTIVRTYRAGIALLRCQSCLSQRSTDMYRCNVCFHQTNSSQPNSILNRGCTFIK